MTILCLFGMFTLFVLLYFADFQRGKVTVITIFLSLIVLFGWIAFECYKYVFHQKKSEQKLGTVNYVPQKHTSPTTINERLTSSKTSSNPITQAKLVEQDVPQESLNDMRMTYTGAQAVNDMKIINESLEIMGKTSDIDTFLSRYEIAMKCALTLEQARKAGIPITLQDGFSKSLVSAKNNALAEVLYRSFQKELNGLNELKTDRGKLNRINNYQEKLKGLYEDVFQFVAEDAYNDVMRKLDFLKNNN